MSTVFALQKMAGSSFLAVEDSEFHCSVLRLDFEEEMRKALQVS